MQAISCSYFGFIGAIVWLPVMPGSGHGFAFGCSDGSVHIYMRDDATVRHVHFYRPQMVNNYCTVAIYLSHLRKPS